MSACHALSNPCDLNDAELRRLLSLAIAAHHYPRHAYASRIFLHATGNGTVNPLTADPVVGGDYFRNTNQSTRS